MNPYVYSKRAPRKMQESQQQDPSVSSLVKHLVSAPISSALAFAVVMLAAGSVASITALASVDIGNGFNVQQDGPTRTASIKAKAQVLGDSTIAPQVVSIVDDSALEAIDAQATLSVKPGTFDTTSGRFNVTL